MKIELNSFFHFPEKNMAETAYCVDQNSETGSTEMRKRASRKVTF